jgi:hypothetical protein
MKLDQRVYFSMASSVDIMVMNGLRVSSSMMAASCAFGVAPAHASSVPHQLCTLRFIARTHRPA